MRELVQIFTRAYAFVSIAPREAELMKRRNPLISNVTVFFAFLVFVAAVVILVLGIDRTLDLGKFWDRYLI